jgi:hypothetical protein
MKEFITNLLIDKVKLTTPSAEVKVEVLLQRALRENSKVLVLDWRELGISLKTRAEIEGRLQHRYKVGEHPDIEDLSVVFLNA